MELLQQMEANLGPVEVEFASHDVLDHLERFRQVHLVFQYKLEERNNRQQQKLQSILEHPENYFQKFKSVNSKKNNF